MKRMEFTRRRKITDMKKKKQETAMALCLVLVASLILTPLVGVRVPSEEAVPSVPVTPSNDISSFFAFLLAAIDLKVGSDGVIF